MECFQRAVKNTECLKDREEIIYDEVAFNSAEDDEFPEAGAPHTKETSFH